MRHRGVPETFAASSVRKRARPMGWARSVCNRARARHLDVRRLRVTQRLVPTHSAVPALRRIKAVQEPWATSAGGDGTTCCRQPPPISPTRPGRFRGRIGGVGRRLRRISFAGVTRVTAEQVAELPSGDIFAYAEDEWTQHHAPREAQP